MELEESAKRLSMGCGGNTGGKEGTRGSGLSTSDVEIGKTQRSRSGGVRGVRGHRKFNLDMLNLR